MALTIVTIFGHFTATMAYNFCFNHVAYEAERDAQKVEESRRPPQRATANRTSTVWTRLSPRKRQRQE
jgi:hypothetical protein